MHVSVEAQVVPLLVSEKAEATEEVEEDEFTSTEMNQLLSFPLLNSITSVFLSVFEIS